MPLDFLDLDFGAYNNPRPAALAPPFPTPRHSWAGTRERVSASLVTLNAAVYFLAGTFRGSRGHDKFLHIPHERVPNQRHVGKC